MSKKNSTDDLVSLSKLDETDILNTLKERYQDKQIYVSIFFIVNNNNSPHAY